MLQVCLTPAKVKAWGIHGKEDAGMYHPHLAAPQGLILCGKHVQVSPAAEPLCL